MVRSHQALLSTVLDQVLCPARLRHKITISMGDRDLTPSASHGLTMQKLTEIKSLLVETWKQTDECLEKFERKKAEDAERARQKADTTDILVEQLEEISRSRGEERTSRERTKSNEAGGWPPLYLCRGLNDIPRLARMNCWGSRKIFKLSMLYIRVT